MLKKFQVENYRGFKDILLWNLSDTRDYGFRKNLVDNKIAKLNTNMRNYLDDAISQDRIHYDEIYARKDEMHKQISGGKGIVIENGVANLTIDDNGILTIGGKRYQLNQI